MLLFGLAALGALAVSTDAIGLDELRVDPARIEATVRYLAAFPTRNTSSVHLPEAAKWVAGEFSKIPGLRVETFEYTVQAGRRVPATKTVVEVVATLPGETDRRVLIGGHIDSINMHAGALNDQAAIEAARAPGANDDLSGVALTLEAARVLSTRHWRHTLTFVAFSGEEEGLYGAEALARHAREAGWKIEGMLNNDMVGNTHNLRGMKNDREVRVFSEELPAHQSRELARYIAWLTDTHSGGLFFDASQMKLRRPSFGVKLVFRKDRFGRGGDHTPFNNEGFTAVRFVEAIEEYSRQHTPQDLPEFVDFNYTANIARLNILTASALAQAADAPTAVRVTLDQSHDTTLTWHGEASGSYVVYWRETTSPTWEGSKLVKGLTVKLDKINKDDHVFAVGSPGGIPVEAR
jgi:Zn-dependent M28 family amino/carboxypeptidase